MDLLEGEKIEISPAFLKGNHKTMVKYRTPAEEILFSVQQWYLSRGLRVPADELKVCKDDIATERREMEYNSALMMKRRLEYEFECVKEEARMAKEDCYEKAADYVRRIAEYKKIIDSSGIVEAPPAAPPKASYGSPEFWKDYWAKKKAAGWVPISPKAPKVPKAPKA